MSVTSDQVLTALRPIVDPDFNQSIVDLGFVKNIAIDGDQVAFDIEVSSSLPIRPSSMFIWMACAIQWMNFILQLL